MSVRWRMLVSNTVLYSSKRTEALCGAGCSSSKMSPTLSEALNDSERSLLADAVALTENHRLHLFPVRADKTPATAHGFKDASNDPQVVASLFKKGERIGLWPGPSGLVVVDIDVKDGAQGEDEWYALTGGRFDHAPQVITPSGGRHLYFRKRPGQVFDNTSLSEGIDIRADAGYVLWPTPDSGYEWDLGYEGEWCSKCTTSHPLL